MRALRPDHRRFLRFVTAGALNTIFGFVVYSASLLLGAPVWAALLIATVTGVAFNFVTTGGYAFRSLMLAHFPRFATSYLGLYVVNWALLESLGRWIPNKILAQAVLCLPLAVVSYLLMAHWVFVTPKTSAVDSPPT
jgi:putative flippase GtrA